MSLSRLPRAFPTDRRIHNRSNAWRRILQKTPRATDAVARFLIVFASLLRFNERLATILLMIVSVGIILLTFSGVSIPLSENGGSIIDKAHALAFALIVGVLAWLGWQFIFTIVPKLTGRRLAVGIFAALSFALSITAIDAPFSVLALGGATGTKLGLVDTSRYYEDKNAFVVRRTAAASQLVPAMNAQKARFEGLAATEIATGALTGRKGEGKVSQTFMQVATSLGALMIGIADGVERANAVQDRLLDEIAAMKSAVFITGDIKERSQAVSIAADRVDRLLGELQRFDYTVSIEATLSILENLIPEQGTARSEFEATQNAELRIIGEMVKPVAASLREALTSMGESMESTGPAPRPLDAVEAIRVYWWQLLPQWIASIFLDLAPFGLLVMLVAGQREIDHQRKNGRGDRE